MKTHWRMWLGAGLIVCILLGGGGFLASQAASRARLTPAEVVESFYAEYLAGAKDVGEARSDPLADASYRSSAHLAPEFVQKVDALIASFDRGGYDPFLCAQDIPETVTVADAKVSSDQATVTMKTSFAGHSLMVQLELAAGQWQIIDISCPSVGS